MPIYMKFGDIKGEVTGGDYAGWIELISIQLGQGRFISRPSRRDRETPPQELPDITVSKVLDSVSPLLAQKAANPRPVEVMIDLVSDDPPERYLRIELSGCVITNYQVSGNADVQAESIVLNFTSITYIATLHD